MQIKNVLYGALFMLISWLSVAWAWQAGNFTMVIIFLPRGTEPTALERLMFLGLGSLASAVFAMIIFCTGVFSLPMMMDRDVDAITAMLTSFNAVWKNKPAVHTVSGES